MLAVALWLLTAVAPAIAHAASAAPAPGDHQDSFKFGGLVRTFIVHVPTGLRAGAKVPVVIMLHGAGGSGAGASEQTGWSREADAGGFIVAYPDGTPPDPDQPASFRRNPRLWNDGRKAGGFGRGNVDDVGFISALIDYLEKNYAADPDRIYLTGFSNGAAMTLRAGVELSGRLAAIAPVSEQLWYDGRTLAAPVPMLFIVGDQDPMNPIVGGEVKLWGPAQYHPPIAQTIAAWRTMLGCGGDGQVARDNGGVKEIVWDKCSKGGEVEFYTIAGMGHVWPGGVSHLPARFVGPSSNALDATKIIWEFFKSHPKQSGSQR